MAESVDRFLKARPDYQVVVLAGSGHLSYGSGIPKRVARRNGLPYAIILNDEEMERGIADYVLFPQPAPGGRSPKLLVTLKEEDSRVFVTGFSHGSGAEKAGLKAGDQIVSVDGVAVRSFEDVRIELVFRNQGDRVSVKVLRPDGAAGKEIAFEVELK
jgi:membrane-associated protease RseP (regulator of RpoE activity)